MEKWKIESEHLKFDEDYTWNRLTDYIRQKYFPKLAYDKVKEKVRGYIRKTDRYKQEHSSETVDNQEKVKITYSSKDKSTTFDGKIIELMSGKPITPEILLKAYNIDGKMFEITYWTANLWQSQIKGGKKLDLYQSKLTVKPRKEPIITFEEIEKHFNSFKNTYKPLNKKYKEIKSNKMREINIADLHFGKLCHNAVSGENFDYKVARERFFKIIDTEVEKVKQTQYEKILFVWCNDFFNADGISNATTGLTPQECDVRWQKMFLIGCEMLVEAIDKLSKYAPVETFYIASNHSRQVEFYAINYLHAWFRNYDNVKIDVNCKARYYYEYGVNLIGFSHSYYEKKNNQPFLMSVEVPEMWARTKYREYHLAHFHSEKVEEKGGVIYRWLPSMTGTDTWHYDSGYIGALKRSYSFEWDKKLGLTSIDIVTIF